MDGLAYIAFVFAAAVLGALSGLAGHFLRALSYVPEDLDLGETISTLTRDNYQFEKHVIGAEWDDNGYWDSESVRNLVYYMASGFAVPLFIGLCLWGQRVETVHAVCSGLKHMGLTPLLCP